MIDIKDLSIQYTGVPLFENASLKINPDDKIALVGSNGTGKSTLLKLLYGIEKPENGSIVKQKGISVGYLPQEFKKISGIGLFNEVKNSLDFITRINAKEEKIQKLLAENQLNEEKRDKLLYELGEIQHKKEENEYYSIDFQIEKVLDGLGFSEDDLTKNITEFSGGWQMRIQLAKILLSQNDLILLDEPTNHLDIDSLSWTIQFLKNYKGALVIVSHDKYFIDHVTEKTMEIFNKKINLYNGKFNEYLKFKEERKEQLLAEKINQGKKIKETERFVERFRYKATKARQVQSRIKQLDKIKQIEIPDDEKNIRIKFPDPPRSGIIAFELSNISKSFNGSQVFDSVSLQAERGDRIAFVGPNGAGKTTLAKIIAGKLQPDHGKVKLGHNVLLSYYSQEVADELNYDQDIMEMMLETDTDRTPGQLRSLLGSFLFHDDDVYKKIKVLSGGEKSRVALARMLLTKSNLIVLDEPTNHLDRHSKRVLQAALQEFTGTLIIVSHDIDFIDPLANKVLDLREGSAKLYPGGIEYYFRKKEEIDIGKQNNYRKLDSDPANKPTKKDQKRIEAEIRQKRYNATKDLKEKIEDTELAISELEEQKSKLELELGKPETYGNAVTAKEKTSEYNSIKTELENLYHSWTELTEKLETVESVLKDSI